MVALLLALAAALPQDSDVGPVLPPEVASAAAAPAAPPADPAPKDPTPAAAAAPKQVAEKIVPLDDRKAETQKLVERPESGPSLGGFLIGSILVTALLVGFFALVKKFGRNSRFLAGGGMIRVLARKPLGPRQEVFLVEVGAKVFLVGSSREQLSTLGEFSNPDDVALLRANGPGGEADSMKVAFRESLREGLREEERPEPAAARVYDSIAGELAEIRKTVRAWKA